MNTRELGDLTPLRAVLKDVQTRRDAARSLKDDRLEEVIGEIADLLQAAIEDALRPPADDGITVKEFAARHEISIWAVYKKIGRQELSILRRLPNGELRLPAA